MLVKNNFFRQHKNKRKKYFFPNTKYKKCGKKN